MKIQVLSDLHNEFLKNARVRFPGPWQGEIPDTTADVVILAGDIDYGINGIEWVINESERLNKPIVYILGNHEFYKQEYYAIKREIKDRAKQGNVHFLDCESFVIGDVRILGLTLWTNYSAESDIPRDVAMFYAERSLNDHQIIQFEADGKCEKFKPADALLLHQTELTWLEEQLKQPFEGKTVVVTHHAPHPVCKHPGYPNSNLGTAFYSNLEEIIANYRIDLWVYGHTHSNLDTVIFDTRIISNQAGYPGERTKDFNPELVVEI